MSYYRHEKYWERFLLPDEKPLHMFGISRLFIVIFWVVPGLLALMLAGAVLWTVNLSLGLVLLAAPASFFFSAILLRYFTHYVITDQRVMSRAGIIHKEFITVDLRSVTDISVHESLLERILTRTALIDLNTAGSDRIELVLKHVRKPMILRKDIYKHQKKVFEKTNGGIVNEVKSDDIES